MKLALLCACFLLGACAPGIDREALLPGSEEGTVEFRRLSKSVWLYTAWQDLPGIGPFPTSGLIVRDGNDTVLVDTAWTDDQTEVILNWSETRLGRKITTAIYTHAHNDKMGGVSAVQSRGITDYALPLTNRLAPSRGLVPAAGDLPRLASDEDTKIGGLTVFFPGGGHTADNIVVAVPQEGVLFGGCLIRPGKSFSLGNTADAVLGSWAGSVAAVSARFPDAEIIVPSHGPPGDRTLLENTRRLVEKGQNAG